MQLHIDAATYFFDLRSFAKLDTLRDLVAELARLLQNDLGTLIVLESQAIQPEPLPVQFQAHWEQYRTR